MGAFPWTYVAPFDDDADAALAAAHADVIAKGAYGKPYARGAIRAKSAAALRRAYGEEGTCSIVDVTALGARPAVGTAGPFPPDVLRRACGTVRPSREVAETAKSALFELLGRGECAYVVCYEAGKPSEVLFLGMSFD